MDTSKDSLIFKLKLSQKQVEEAMLRVLQLDTQINSKEEKYFKGMTKHAGSYYMEFVVPLKETN